MDMLNPMVCEYEESIFFSANPPEFTVWFRVPVEELYKFFRKPEEGGDDYGNVVCGCLALTMDGSKKLLDPTQSFRLSLSPVVSEDNGESDCDSMALVEGVDFSQETIQELIETYLEQRVSWLKQRQIAGDLTRCPRCGKEMDGKPTRNAVSRRTDVYVCNTCGTLEALYACQHNGKPEPLRTWVCSKMFTGG